LRDYLELSLKKLSAHLEIVGIGQERLANTTMVLDTNALDASTQVVAFDLKGIAISSGAACSSGKINVSHVLLAIGHLENEARKAIRISIGFETTRVDIDYFIECYKKINNIGN
jgi:cysteine desulfurase